MLETKIFTNVVSRRMPTGRAQIDLDMDKGDRVRWHLLGMGNEVDLHAPHWHTAVVKINGQYADVAELLPESMKWADMLADNSGQWMSHCYVADHITAGMTSLYRVHEK